MLFNTVATISCDPRITFVSSRCCKDPGPQNKFGPMVDSDAQYTAIGAVELRLLVQFMAKTCDVNSIHSQPPSPTTVGGNMVPDNTLDLGTQL